MVKTNAYCKFMSNDVTLVIHQFTWDAGYRYKFESISLFPNRFEKPEQLACNWYAWTDSGYLIRGAA